MTKDRITFLYFLFEKVDISDIAESRVANNEFDTTQIIGKFPTERKRILSVVVVFPASICAIIPMFRYLSNV